MKKRFLDSLPSDWIKYLVVIVLSVLLWVWVFGLYHAPKETEKLEVFYAGAVKDYAVEETTADALGLKLVSISSAYPWTGHAFDEKYSLVALTASDVAEQLHIHPSYLHRLFREYTSRTMKDHLQRIRIGHAQELLAGTRKSVLEIACEVGFSNTQQFQQIFRRLTGMRPLEYRRMQTGH